MQAPVTNEDLSRLQMPISRIDTSEAKVAQIVMGTRTHEHIDLLRFNSMSWFNTHRCLCHTLQPANMSIFFQHSIIHSFTFNFTHP